MERLLEVLKENAPLSPSRINDNANIKRKSWRYLTFGDAHYDTHHFVEPNVASRASKEVGSALLASMLIAPMVGIIDKTIYQPQQKLVQHSRAVSSTATAATATAMRLAAIQDATRAMISNPLRFLKSNHMSIRLTTAVYFGTFAMANLSDMYCDMKRMEDYEERRSYKFAATSLTNVGLLAWRDSIFARTFGGNVAPASSIPSNLSNKLPMTTRSMFAIRDASTMYATFYVAPKAAKYLQEQHHFEKYSSELAMALCVPFGMQFVTAPMHIYGMDYMKYPPRTNNPSSLSRLAVIVREFQSIAFARSLRIIPAFGFGSFFNNCFRESLIQSPTPDEVLPATSARVTIARRRTVVPVSILSTSSSSNNNNINKWTSPWDER